MAQASNNSILRVSKIHMLSRHELKSELERRNLSTEGSTSELRNRLEDSLFSNADKCVTKTPSYYETFEWELDFSTIDILCNKDEEKGLLSKNECKSILSTTKHIKDWEWYFKFGISSGSPNNTNTSANNNTSSTDNTGEEAKADCFDFHMGLRHGVATFAQYTLFLFSPGCKQFLSFVGTEIRKYDPGSMWGWKGLELISELKSKYNCSGILRMRIAVEVFGQMKSEGSQSFHITKPQTHPFKDSLKRAFQQKLLSDVTITVSGLTYYAPENNNMDREGTGSSSTTVSSLTGQIAQPSETAEDDDETCSIMDGPPRKRRKRLGMSTSAAAAASSSSTSNSSSSSNGKSGELDTIKGLDDSSSQLLDDASVGESNGNECKSESPYQVTLEILSHRFWLGLCSPVFRAMMEGKWAEKESGKIKITDCDPYVMRALIQYLYTDQISSNVNRLELLLCADKYQIAQLVSQCLQDLMETINTDNVCSILAVTSKLDHSKDALTVKKQCLKLISSQLAEVRQTEGYKKHMTQSLLDELVAQIVSSDQNPTFNNGSRNSSSSSSVSGNKRKLGE